MSAAAVAHISYPSSSNLRSFSIRSTNGIRLMAIPIRRSSYSRSLSLSELPFRISPLSLKRRRERNFHGAKSVSPVMEWQHWLRWKSMYPASVAYKCYFDREAINEWMLFLSSDKKLGDDSSLSRWTFKYNAFGRDIEFSWLARYMQPIPNQKKHWRSLEGLPNRGAVRFYPKGPSSCVVELTVSYEVPPLWAPVASALQPLIENLLQLGLERFATSAMNSQTA